MRQASDTLQGRASCRACTVVAANRSHRGSLAQYLDKILELMRDTPYEAVARQWKTNPASASGGAIACMTCHEQGRLKARLTSLNKQ